MMAPPVEVVMPSSSNAPDSLARSAEIAWRSGHTMSRVAWTVVNYGWHSTGGMS